MSPRTVAIVDSLACSTVWSPTTTGSSWTDRHRSDCSTINALTAADAVLIPIQCEFYALEGLAQLTATVNLVRDHLNPDLEINGVVLTMFDARTNLSAEVADEVRRHLGPAVYATQIPRSVRLSEAPSYGQPIALYRPDSRGAEAYESLAIEFMTRAAAATQSTPSARREPLQAGAA